MTNLSSLNENLNKKQSLFPLLQWVVLPFFLGMLIIPYFQVELTTTWNTDLTKELSQFCLEKNPVLKYAKILNLDNQNQTVEVYCSFKPRELNVILHLAKHQEKWQLTRAQSANSFFTWPVYL